MHEANANFAFPTKLQTTLDIYQKQQSFKYFDISYSQTIHFHLVFAQTETMGSSEDQKLTWTNEKREERLEWSA